MTQKETYEQLVWEYERKIRVLEERKKIILEAKSNVIREGLLLSYANQHRRLMENFFADCVKLKNDNLDDRPELAISQRVAMYQARIKEQQARRRNLFNPLFYLRKFYAVCADIMRKNRTVPPKKKFSDLIGQYRIKEDKAPAQNG